MGKSRIEWTEYTWNPVTGCSKISSGCDNCYARKMAHRWYGHFDVTLHPDRMAQPFDWKKPRKIFVCSAGDLFHSQVPDSFINQVFDTMLHASWHTFMVLTKRPQRVNDWRDLRKLPDNVWIGVSVEDQQTANERIPVLLKIPASVLFVSCEPLLELVDLSEWLGGNNLVIEEHRRSDLPLNWLICGGESGHGARPCDLDWLRILRDQCEQAGTPFFLKQLGGWPDKRGGDKALLDGSLYHEFPDQR